MGININVFIFYLVINYTWYVKSSMFKVPKFIKKKTLNSGAEKRERTLKKRSVMLPFSQFYYALPPPKWEWRSGAESGRADECPTLIKSFTIYNFDRPTTCIPFFFHNPVSIFYHLFLFMLSGYARQPVWPHTTYR